MPNALEELNLCLKKWQLIERALSDVKNAGLIRIKAPAARLVIANLRQQLSVQLPPRLAPRKRSLVDSDSEDEAPSPSDRASSKISALLTFSQEEERILALYRPKQIQIP